MSQIIPITIIGGGVCGCAIAYELSKLPVGDIALLERNAKIRGENQSSRNSGVIHAGIYYPRDKEPLKARFCVEGNRLLYEFCEEYGIPHKRTGKLVAATNPMEEEYLEDTLRIARENGVPGVERIDGEKVREYEPNVLATSAIYVPSSGIIDATELVSRLHMLAECNGVMFGTGNEVVDVRAEGNRFVVVVKVRNTTDKIETRVLVNAAGLYSDIIMKMIDPRSPYRIVPIRGESARFYSSKRDDIAMNGMSVYPVPIGHFPDGRRLEVPFDEFQEMYLDGKVSKTTGIHLTPTLDLDAENHIIGKTVTIGPAYSVGQIDREDYGHSVDAPYYLNGVTSFFPGLELEDISLHQTGINAKLQAHSDFVIEKDPGYPNLVNLLGITSPGLTSALAIARYVRELLD